MRAVHTANCGLKMKLNQQVRCSENLESLGSFRWDFFKQLTVKGRHTAIRKFSDQAELM